MENKIIINESNFNELICKRSFHTIKPLTTYKFLDNNDNLIIYSFKETGTEIVKWNYKTINNGMFYLVLNEIKYHNLFLYDVMIANDKKVVLHRVLQMEDDSNKILTFLTI